MPPGELEQCRPQLRSYLLRMTASMAATDDLKQEAEKITSEE